MNNNDIYIRALEPEDIEYLYKWENDDAVWEATLSPIVYSKYVLNEYIKNSFKSIYEIGQQRFMICNKCNNCPIGTIDLFEYDNVNKRAGIGVLIFDKEDRNKGFASSAIKLVEDFAKNKIGMKQVFCNISENNLNSIKLFEKNGYVKCAEKLQWIHIDGNWLSELMYQKILF